MGGMDAGFQRFLNRYGQTVQVCRGGETAVCRAFVQPVLERREDWRQTLPTPLGELRRDRWLYLGDPEVSLEGLGEGWVACNGRRFSVTAAQPVYIGSRRSHWWAVLAPREEAGE